MMTPKLSAIEDLLARSRRRGWILDFCDAVLEFGNTALPEALLRRHVTRRPSDQEAWRFIGDRLFTGTIEALFARRLARKLETDGILEGALRRAGHASKTPADWHLFANELDNAGLVFCAGNAYEKALALQPEDPYLLTDFGIYLARLGLARRAAAVLARAFDRDRAWAAASYGLALANAGRAAEGVGLLRDAVNAKPEDGELRFNLSVALRRARRWKEALEENSKAIRLGDSSADAFNALGWTHERLGDFERAELNYRAALERDVDHARATENLGWLFARTGRDGAAQIRKASLRIDDLREFTRDVRWLARAG